MNFEFIKNNFSLEGKKVLVTGSSRGIGLASSIFLSNFGARILRVARNKIDLEKTNSSLFGKDNDWIDADLSTEQGIEILINKIKDWGIPDIIVANVYLRSNSIKLKNINSSSVPLINNNLEHLFQLIPICIEEQRKNKFGRWIGISSMISKMGGPGQSIYSMQKSALESLFKTIAIEEGKNGITANTISPGIIESPGAKSNYPNELLDTFSKMNLIGRAGKEEDVASAVLFLASPISSYITGVDIPVCGGYNLSWGIQYALEGKLNL